VSGTERPPGGRLLTSAATRRRAIGLSSQVLGFLLMLCLLELTACNSAPKNAAILRMHLPASPAATPIRRMPVTIRTPALTLEVDRLPVLSEADLDHVDLTGEGDNFGIRLFFNTHGTIMLDTVSLNNRGQLLVIIINGVPVAAPQLRERIVDGVFDFTPDISREEAEKIVKGLNASAEYIRKKK
jgi:hypothetical protein